MSIRSSALLPLYLFGLSCVEETFKCVYIELLCCLGVLVIFLMKNLVQPCSIDKFIPNVF